jgi:predicted short-subunit dehydrogenase-like oxidoreductase (DUF2520 family)
MIKSVSIIGSGNVATHLAKVLYDHGIEINQVYSKSLKNAKKLANNVRAGFTDDLAGIKPNSDLYIIAVSDDVIEKVVKGVSIDTKILVHTSGSVNIELLNQASKNYGSFYPLQTFTKSVEVSFETIPMCIEGSNKKTENELTALALSLSSNVNKISSEQRKKLHLAAVFACNFSNYMQIIAEDLCEENNVSFNLLKPLIKETFEKGSSLLPSENQTGPARRGDHKIMQKHIDLLANKQELKEIYSLMSNQIIKKYKS